MTKDEVRRLAEELDVVNESLRSYADVNTACADGYFRATDQVANMGAHFNHNGRIDDGVFDPAEPEILLYVNADGTLPAGGAGAAASGTPGWASPRG